MNSGRKLSFKEALTRNVSVALQTDTYWVLASIATLNALEGSASLSIYVWQTPSACPSTAILVFCMMYWTKELDPLGIIRSIYSSSLSISAISERSVRRLSQPSGSPASMPALLITDAKALLVLIASEPPFRKTALPLFMQRDAIWTRASGLLSKITPITPIGQVTRVSSSPSSRSVLKVILPTGSARPIRLSIPETTSFSLSSLNLSLLRSGASRSAFSASSRSILLAEKISSFASLRQRATLARALFFISLSNEART